MFCSKSETEEQETLPSWQDLSSDGGTEAAGRSVPTPHFHPGPPVLKLAHKTHLSEPLGTRLSRTSPRPVHNLWDLAKDAFPTIYPI